MTVIENDNPKMHYQGPISSGDELPLDFPYTNAVDVKCMVDKSILVQGPDFTVSGLTVTIKRDVPAGSTVTLYRETPLDQQAEFPQNNKFSSQKINEALDKICMQQQEQSETLSRCITASISLENFNGELPTPAPKQVLMWNENVTALENYDIIGENEAFQESIREELAETVENIEEEFNDFKQETDRTIGAFRSEVNENIQNFKDETDGKIEDFKQETNQTISAFRRETNDKIEDFKQETNQTISAFRRETNDKIETFEGTVNSQITEIRGVANATTAVANEALQVANSTIDTSNTALNAANRAVETANEASSKSDTAIGTANLASENSYQAINTANEANVTAGNARDVADSARNTAVAASNTANAASTKVDEFGETIEVVIEAAEKIQELEGAVEEAKEAAGTATVAADAAVEAADAAIEALSSKQDKLTAGPGIRITENNVIENTRESAEWGKITGNMGDQPDLTNKFNDIDAKIRDIELFKFPNAVIIGEPTIQNGQVSDFSVVSYLQFPFVLDLHDQAFQIDFCFTTATNVQTQQNILDSNFGIALAIQEGKGVMAISSNGTSWDIGSATGSINIQSNTTYYARLIWNKLQYKTFLSTDGVNYTQDMVLTGAVRPYPRTIYIGGCDQLETGHAGHPFLGTINMNKATMSVNNQVIWQGMDDAGLSTRADLSLSNLDELGEARFTNLQDAINTKQPAGDYATNTALSTGLASKQNTLVSGTNIKTINNESILGSGNIEVKSAPDLDNITINKNNNEELQAIGFIDSGDNQAYKERFVTEEEYNSMKEAGTLDPHTYYNTEGFGSSSGGGTVSGASRPLFERTILDYVSDDESYGMADFFEEYNKEKYPKAYNKLVEEYNNGIESYKEGAFTKIGNPNISSDYVVSNFSRGNCLLLNGAKTVDTIYSEEFVLKVTTGNSLPESRLLQETDNISGYDDGYKFPMFGLYDNGNFNMFRIKSDKSLILNCHAIKKGTTQPNTTYWLKWTYSDGIVSGYYSTNGKDYIFTESQEINYTPFIGHTEICMGMRYKDGSGVWNGSFDLKETYFIINNEVWWYGTMPYKDGENGLRVVDGLYEESVKDKYNSNDSWFYVLDQDKETFRLPRSKALIEDINEKTNTNNHLYFYLGGN